MPKRVGITFSDSLYNKLRQYCKKYKQVTGNICPMSEPVGQAVEQFFNSPDVDTARAAAIAPKRARTVRQMRGQQTQKTQSAGSITAA